MSTVAAQDLDQGVPAPPAARLRPLFAPRGIAVIGASRDPAKLRAAMTRSLAGFAGAVAGINPRDADPQAGRYQSVAEAAAATVAPIDLAILYVPASRSAGALADAAEAGVRAALVCSGGYAEAGGAGVGHRHDLLAAVRFTNPTTGGGALPTMRTEMHRLRAGTSTARTRTTVSSVWQVSDGRGTVALDGKAHELGHGDVAAVPSWCEVSLRADTDLNLFTFSDAPIFEKLSLRRTDVSS